MTAYTLTPMGLDGLEEERAEVVQGPSLRDSLTRAELSRRLVAQEEELQRLRRHLVVAQAAARHMERLRLRMDNESALRVRAQQRLNRVALGLGVIAGLHCDARSTVAAVRDDIFGIEEETGV